jgi:hypothetical protein
MTVSEFLSAATAGASWRELMNTWRPRAQLEKAEAFQELSLVNVAVALQFARDVGVKARVVEIIAPRVFRLDASEMEKPMRALAANIGLLRLEELLGKDSEVALLAHSPANYWLRVLRSEVGIPT